MNNFIQKLKTMDKTKRIVILFITISFVFIFGISVYRSITENNILRQPSTNEVVDKTPQESTSDTQDEPIEKENPTKTPSKPQENKEEQKENPKPSTHQESQSTPSQNSEPIENNDHPETSPNEESSLEETDSIQIEVIGINETMMSGQLDIDENSTAYSVLKELALQNNVKIYTSGYGSMVYVRGIGDLMEKQHGSGSGWMYKVNSVPPNIGAGNYTLKDGDQVVWYYVNYE